MAMDHGPKDSNAKVGPVQTNPPLVYLNIFLLHHDTVLQIKYS